MPGRWRQAQGVGILSPTRMTSGNHSDGRPYTDWESNFFYMANASILILKASWYRRGTSAPPLFVIILEDHYNGKGEYVVIILISKIKEKIFLKL